MGRCVAVAAAVLGTVAPLSAAEAPAAPAPIKVTVVSVEGLAQKRLATDPEEKWEALKPGEELDELAILRTGLGAQVVLKLADRGTVTIRSGSKVGLREFRQEGEQLKARLGLKYGSMHARVDSARGPNDFQVKTAVATLSVRGTGGAMAFWGDFGLHLRGTDGVWGVGTAFRSIRVHRGEHTDGQLTPSSELDKQDRDVRLGDALGGLTPEEARNLREHGGGRGVFGFVGSTADTGPSFIPEEPFLEPTGPEIEGPPSCERPLDRAAWRRWLEFRRRLAEARRRWLQQHRPTPGDSYQPPGYPNDGY